tara:strand:+ start:314 stop:1483 length:1170 start_codon:yes stop_codon:yes gene_type:complete
MRKLNKKNILFISGSRADFGLLSSLIKKLQKKKTFNTKVLALAQHTNNKFGETFSEIKSDKIKNVIKMKKKIISSKDIDISNYFSEVVKKTNKIISQNKPDLLIVLGDRFEIMGSVISAYLNNVKIAHIHGGEKTYGSKDDCLRHSISKLSNYHFVSHTNYRERLIQLGENKKNIYVVGGLGAERINKTKYLSKKKLEKKLKIKLFKKKNFLITFNSFEKKTNETEKKLDLFLSVLEKFEDTNFIFTLANHDPFSDIINKKIKIFCNSNKNAFVFKSLGFKNYISLLKQCDLIIGNSSSGILEAPSFGIPTINIGLRQKGRIFAKSIIQASYSKKNIYKIIINMQNKKFRNYNPYFVSNTSSKIIEILNKINLRENQKFKEFVDIKLKK